MTILDVALAIIAVAALLFLVRLVVGPSIADRTLALDGLLVTVMCGVLVGAVRTESSAAIDSIIVIALLGFVATGAFARFAERQDRP